MSNFFSTEEVRLKTAHSAGWDAGTRSMKAAGRERWNADDYRAAVMCSERVMTNPPPRKCPNCGTTFNGLVHCV